MGLSEPSIPIFVPEPDRKPSFIPIPEPEYEPHEVPETTPVPERDPDLVPA